MKERVSNGFDLLTDGADLQEKLITKVTETQTDMSKIPYQSNKIQSSKDAITKKLEDSDE